MARNQSSAAPCAVGCPLSVGFRGWPFTELAVHNSRNARGVRSRNLALSVNDVCCGNRSEMISFFRVGSDPDIVGLAPSFRFQMFARQGFMICDLSSMISTQRIPVEAFA